MIKKGNLVHVKFISESRTEFSGNVFEGDGVIDRAEDGYVFGRLLSGETFMCNDADVCLIPVIIGFDPGTDITHELLNKNG